MIKAVLIDPYKETVTDITYDGNYRSIYPLIHCTTFTVLNFNDDDLFIDDEGLLYVNNMTKFFSVPTYPKPLAGYGMIIGYNDEGDAANVRHNAAYYRSKIHFLDVEMVRLFGYYKQ